MALRTERQLGALEEMREIGLMLARSLGRQAVGAAGPEEARVFQGANAGMVFARIARAVRQIVALEREIMGVSEKRVLEVAQNREQAAQRIARAQAARAQEDDEARATEERKLVRRAVRASMRADDPYLDREELRETLDALFDDYDDFAGGTLPEIVTRICADLGITPDLSLWEGAGGRDAEESPVPAVSPMATKRARRAGIEMPPHAGGHDPPS